mmetsp:Transcript_17048/g.35791  ORF Transcript_17048/g.35791 Transcript_17048/m.35791 type:complete len:89 (-) Transcript_17048:326-592(-)
MFQIFTGHTQRIAHPPAPDEKDKLSASKSRPVQDERIAKSYDPNAENANISRNTIEFQSDSNTLLQGKKIAKESVLYFCFLLLSWEYN